MKHWRVADVMTTPVVCVRAHIPYGDIVNTLAKHKISAVPVLDRFGRVIGVVSEADLLHKVEYLGKDIEPQIFEWGSRKADRAKARGATAEQLMTAPAVTVRSGASVVEAARLIQHEHVKRLPVVNELGRLVGIVSRNDLLKMYLRPDYELRHEVVENVLRRMLWINPLPVEADVIDGVVTLNGNVDRKSTAELAVHVTKSVPGVIRVVDQVTWNDDDTAVDASTDR